MNGTSQTHLLLVYGRILLITLVITPPTGAAVLAQPGGGADPVQATGDHLVTQLGFNLDTPNILRTNQDLVVNFELQHHRSQRGAYFCAAV